jgi:hypothetical protein
MSAGFEAGRDDRIHTRILERLCLRGRRSRTEGDDVEHATSLEHVGRWHAIDEAEYLRTNIEEHLDLFVEARRESFGAHRQRHRKLFVVRPQRLEGTIEIGGGDVLRLALERDPQIQRERALCALADAPRDLSDARAIQMVNAERSEQVRDVAGSMFVSCRKSSPARAATVNLRLLSVKYAPFGACDLRAS